MGASTSFKVISDQLTTTFRIPCERIIVYPKCKYCENILYGETTYITSKYHQWSPSWIIYCNPCKAWQRVKGENIERNLYEFKDVIADMNMNDMNKLWNEVHLYSLFQD